jgi:hypothetical protein
MVTGSSITLVDDFTHFTGDLGPFISALYWNNADVEIHLTGFSPNFARKGVAQYLKQDPDIQRSEFEDFTKRYDIGELSDRLQDGGFRIYPLPIDAKATLFIHGRPVSKTTATLVIVNSSDAEIHDFIVAKFPVITINKDTFVAPSGGEALPELRTNGRDKD